MVAAISCCGESGLKVHQESRYIGVEAIRVLSISRIWSGRPAEVDRIALGQVSGERDRRIEISNRGPCVGEHSCELPDARIWVVLVSDKPYVGIHSHRDRELCWRPF